MLSEVKKFVNWLRRTNPHVQTWKDDTPTDYSLLPMPIKTQATIFLKITSNPISMVPTWSFGFPLPILD